MTPRQLQQVWVRFADGCTEQQEMDKPVTEYETCKHGAPRTAFIFPEWTGEDGNIEDDAE